MGYLTKTTVYLKGKLLTTTFNSLSLHQEICDHHHLEISFRPDLFEQMMSNINSSTISLFGEKISVEIDDEEADNMKVQFVGVVTQVKKVTSNFGGEGDEIVLVAKSPTINMDSGPHCRSFTDKKVSDVVKQIIGNYSALKSEIRATKSTMKYLAQHNESDFDFICRLAVQYGQWCYYNGEKLVFGNDSGTSKPIELNFSKDLIDFQIDMLPLPKNFEFISFDPKVKETVKASTTPRGKFAKINKDSTTTVLVNPATGAVSGEFINQMAEAQSASFEPNEIRFSGTSNNPDVTIGSAIKIEDEGTFRVIKITHSCNDLGNYENRIEAVAGNGFPYTNVRVTPKAQNQIGIVKQIHEDPDGLGRIKVKLPYQESGADDVWMRMLTPHAGNNRGFFFLPEVDDEVLVGFEGGNAEHPYILGALWNGKDKPPLTANEQNSQKLIKTREGLTITFDDEKKELTIQTPGQNKIFLSDDTKIIEVADENGNRIEMSPEGIVFDSVKDISIKAAGDINIEAINLNMKASAKASLEALSIDQKASTDFKAQGSASAELSASGQTTVKGAMVMIN